MWLPAVTNYYLPVAVLLQAKLAELLADLLAFLPQGAKIEVRLGLALGGNSPPDCCI